MTGKIKAAILLLILSLLFVSFAAYATDADEDYDLEDYTSEMMRGIVLAVETVEANPDVDFVQIEQEAEIKFTTGSLKGETRIVNNALFGHPLYDIELVEGQELYFVAEYSNGELVNIGVSGYIRDRYVYLLVFLFVLAMLLVGKSKGLKALISLSITIILILKVFLPQLIKGTDPIFLSIPIAVLITLITLTVIGGFNSKSLTAIIGTMGGVLVAGFLALLVGTLAQLTGFSSEEAQMLQYANTEITNIKGIIFAGIIIGSLGAVMDVAMSISSSCNELVSMNNNISRSQLIRSGMNVGRDIMGTMSNTLILAYTGSAISLLLLFYAYGTPIIHIINLDLVATEIVRALAGTFGLLMAIPLTAVVAGFLMPQKAKGKKEEELSG